MCGEKLKELEKGKVTEPRPEKETPAIPPKFVTHVSYILSLLKFKKSKA